MTKEVVKHRKEDKKKPVLSTKEKRAKKNRKEAKQKIGEKPLISFHSFVLVFTLARG